jgi:hypothetical protein
MIRLLLTITASAIAVLSSSCGCCTGDAKAPSLRKMPKFKEIPTEPEVAAVNIFAAYLAQVEYTEPTEVEYTK